MNHTEQLDFDFLGVPDAKTKETVLLTNLPMESYQLARDLVAPPHLKDDAITNDVIVKRMQKQLKPERSKLVVKFEFDNQDNNSGESVSHYVATLERLEIECKFGETMRTERLRNRQVSGICDPKMIT